MNTLVTIEPKRAQIIAPTGSGKTLIEHHAIIQSIKRGGKIHLVLAPRIALVHQLINEFHNYKEVPWNALCVCSSQAEFEEYYEGESSDLTVSTEMNSTVIATHIVKAASAEGDPIIIFSTMHSTVKIASAVIISGLPIDLVVVDEAHNMTREKWHDWLTDLKAKAWLYFTATRKISKKVDKNGQGIGRGMNNEDFFGSVKYSIQPNVLINSGRIVPPRMHLVYPADDVILPKGKEDMHGSILLVVGGALKHAEIMNGMPARIIVFCEGAEEAHDMAECVELQNALPGWFLAAVTSKNHRMKGKRKDIFDQFSNEERAILFHYDVISEGIDLPGTTAILPLRELGEIKIVQAVGRALRISTNDRAALKNKLISVGKSEGWQKPFGWVILPWFGDDNSGAIDRVCDWVYALRSANFNYDVERMTVVEQPKGGINPPIDDLSPDLDRNDKTTGIDMTLFNIDKKVKHELEAEEAMYKEKLEPIKKVKPGFLAKCRGKVT